MQELIRLSEGKSIKKKWGDNIMDDEGSPRLMDASMEDIDSELNIADFIAMDGEYSIPALSKAFAGVAAAL